jgi:two-component system LytT family sensor kinase
VQAVLHSGITDVLGPLVVSLRVVPEILPIAVPFLVVQPLVENAVRHGLEGHTGVVTVEISGIDDGSDALISVEDDGPGSDPEVIRSALDREWEATTVGLGNVDARLRHVYGDSYGLVVETAPTAGTKVSFRVPKFAPGVDRVDRVDPVDRVHPAAADFAG